MVKRRTSAVVAGTARPARGLPPEEALRKWSDPKVFARMLTYSDSANQVTATPEGERRHRKYGKYREELETAFYGRLRSGEVFASGILPSGDRREIIRPELWDVLQVDFEFDIIAGRDRRYESAEFFDPAAFPRNVTDVPEWVAAYSTQRRRRSDAPLPPVHILFAVEGQSVRFNSGYILEDESADLILILLPVHTQGHENNLTPAVFGHVPTGTIAKRLGITEQTLRRRITRIRQGIKASYENVLGVTLGRDDVIENVSWKGYRINPRAIRVKPWQLRGADVTDQASEPDQTS